MTFRTTPALGPELEQASTAFYYDVLSTYPNTSTQITSYQLGSRVSGTDGGDYLYVKAGTNIDADTQLAITSDGSFIATSGGTSGFYTVEAVAANQFFHARGGEGPPPFSLVIAGNRFDVMTGTNSLPQPYTSQRHHYVGGEGDVTNIQAIDVNWIANANGTTTATSARTIKKFLEYPVGSGIFHQFTWGGSPTVLIPAGGTVQSDTLLSSVSGLPLILTADDMFYERTVNLTVVTDMPSIVLSAGSTVLGIPDGNVAADQGNSGTIAATTGTRTFGSIAMIGRVNGISGVRSFLLTADSLGWGQADATSTSSRGSIGFPWRTLDKYNFPGVKIAVQGLTASAFASNIANPNMVDLMTRIGPYLTDGWNELGINDIGGAGTPASIKASWQTIYGAYFSGKTVHQSTLTMRNDSSDGFATDANQTIKVQGNMSLWAAFNDEIRLGLPNVDHIIDAQRAAAANLTYPTNWSGPPYPMVNADGVHILSAKAASMATALTIV